MGYRGYGLPVTEIISEGNVGLMQALNRFEPEKGFRFATYAMWWIRASIHDYILRSWSLVRIGTTTNQRKLFFKLRSAKNKIAAFESGDLHPDQVALIANKLDVTDQDVVEMNRRLGGDKSINAPIRHDDETDEWRDHLVDQSPSPEAIVVAQDENDRQQKALVAAIDVLDDRERRIFEARHLADEPPLQTSFQGNAQAFGDSLSSTPILIVAALFVVYLILGVLYESLIHPITIISTLPSAGLGALLLLMAVHYDLSVIAIVGIILLIGIVKKNGIMLVDFAQHVEHEQGWTAEDSIYQACIMRFRPILMTTMAALLGGVPMMLGTGVGSEIRPPLGYAIVGGLALSQILTLYTTPVVYIYLDRLQTWLFGQKKQAAAAHAEPAPAE